MPELSAVPDAARPSTGRRRSLSVLLGAALCVALSAQAQPWAGRAIRDVLAELGGPGFQVVYDARLVSPTLRVLQEPAAAQPVAMLREMLAPHGLELVEVGPGAYAVAPADQGAGVLRGRVRGPGAEGIAGARVEVQSTGQAVLTGPDGTFTLRGLPGGRYDIRVQHPAYADAARAGVIVRSREATDLDLTLRPRPPALEEVVVTVSQYALAFDTPAAGTFLDQQEVFSLPKAADETLRVLHRLPGSASTGVAAPPHVRGGEQGEILYRLDGLELYEPFHGKDFLNVVSIFDSRFVDGMEIYSGGFTAEYGDRMSGVVDIRSLAAGEEPYFELGLSLFHTSGLTTGAFAEGRGSWLASFRRSNLDEIADLANSDFGEAKYFDTLLRLSYDVGERTTVAANFLESRDDIGVNNSAATEFAEAEYRNTYLWGTLDHAWSDRFDSRLLVSLTDVDNVRQGSVAEAAERNGRVSDDRAFRFASVKLDFSLDTGLMLTRFGAETREMEADYRYVSDIVFAADYPFPGDPVRGIQRDIDLEPDGHQHAAWLTSKFRITDRLTTELGLRWDDQGYDGLDDSAQWSPRINLLYELGDDTRLRAGWGRFYQSQRINELQVEDGEESYARAQRADHAVIGLEHLLADGLQLRVEAYYKEFSRLRPRYENLFDPLVLLPELEPDRIKVAPRSATGRGVEVSLNGQGQGPWSWWANYAWSRVTDRLGGTDVPRSWDQRHSVNLGVHWSSDPWDVTVAGTWHTGWPTTPVRLQDGQAIVGPRNSERFADFASLDFKLSRRFALDRGELEAFLEVTNFLLLENPCCVEYRVTDTPGGAPLLQRTEDYWPRIVPNLGVFWRF